MLLWTAIALLTLAAAYAVLSPLFQREDGEAYEDEPSVAVFKDQLSEIDRDEARGVLPAEEAEAARREIARRLLRASRMDTRLDRSPWRRRSAAIIVAACVPLIGFGVYTTLGNPEAPDRPLAARSGETDQPMSLEGMVEMVEARLDVAPEDGVGWGVIAPIYLSLGRYTDAATAFRNAMTYDGETAARFTGLGESLLLAANGTVTVQAAAAFERALSIDPAAIKPRVFLAVAARQRGAGDEALQRWSVLLDGATGQEPWAQLAQRELAALGADDMFPGTGAPAGPAPQAGAEGGTDAMIAGMVARLAGRLAAEGGSAEEWVQLMRSHLVLGDTASASAAYEDGLVDLAGDEAGIATLRAGATAMGLPVGQ